MPKFEQVPNDVENVILISPFIYLYFTKWSSAAANYHWHRP
jgi:hypothetical protein